MLQVMSSPSSIAAAHPPKAITTNINTLPPELLTQICLSLSRPDLRSCRSTSPSLNAAGSPILYSTIYLKVNRTSFNRLQEIADSPTLSDFVRHLLYDGSILYYHSSSEPNFREWKRMYAGNGLPSYGDEEWTALFSPSQLLEFYQRYCLYLTGQRYILGFENEKMLLIAALRKLRSLKSVMYYLKENGEAENWDDEEDRRVPFSALPAIAKDILVLPNKDYTTLSSNHIWNLLDSIARAGLANVTEVAAKDLSLRRWNEVSGPHTECYNIFPGLESLSMEFVFEGVTFGDALPLKQVLTHCTNLRDLRVSFDTMIFSEVWAHKSRCVYLSNFMPKDKTWRYLQRLSLKAIGTTQRELETLLGRHRDTLRSLEVANCLFERDMTIEDPEKRHGNWVNFLRFLNTDMKLERVKFVGILFNGVDESWFVLDEDEEKNVSNGIGWSVPSEKEILHAENCLRRRVEKFVTRKGPFPFKPYDTKGLPSTSIGPPWVDDASWRAELFMLGPTRAAAP